MVLDKAVELLPAAPADLTLAFIPTARDPYHITAATDPEKEKIQSMGFSVREVDLKNKSIKQLRKEFEGIDVIFVAGGNTLYLLEKAIESGFVEIVNQLVEKGVVYIGSSAGSVLAGPDIAIARDLDEPLETTKLTTTKGLGLVNFVVLPHFGEGPYKEKTKEVYKKWRNTKYKIIPLTDKQAVLVTGDRYKIIEA